MSKIRKIAGANIEILGFQPNDVMEEYMMDAKAFVFAAEERFWNYTSRSTSVWYPGYCIWKRGYLKLLKIWGRKNQQVFFL